jgi:hypothetical protein
MILLRRRAFSRGFGAPLSAEDGALSGDTLGCG